MRFKVTTKFIFTILHYISMNHSMISSYLLMSFSTFLVFVPHVFYNMTWCHIIWGSPEPQTWAKPIGDFSHLSRNCIMTKPTQNNKPKSETIALTNVLKIRPNRSTNQFVGWFKSNGWTTVVSTDFFKFLFFF